MPAVHVFSRFSLPFHVFLQRFSVRGRGEVDEDLDGKTSALEIASMSLFVGPYSPRDCSRPTDRTMEKEETRESYGGF